MMPTELTVYRVKIQLRRKTLGDKMKLPV